MQCEKKDICKNFNVWGFCSDNGLSWCHNFSQKESETIDVSLDIIDIKSGSTFDFCTYVISVSGREVKRFEDVAYTQKAFVNFHEKIFDDFGSYIVDKKLLQEMSDYDYSIDPHYSDLPFDRLA